MKTTTCAAIAVVAIALVSATGCISTKKSMMPGNIIASTKPVEQGKYTVLNGGNVVTGKYTIDLLHAENNDVSGSAMKKACDQALAQAPGADALVDIKTDALSVIKTWRFPQIPLEVTYTTFVTGVPVKTNE